MNEHHPLNIMLAVDGSEHAQAAVTLVHDLPLPSESTITALAVVIPRQAQFQAWAMMDVLKRTQEDLADSKVQVRTELLTGYPAEILYEFAFQNRPDLIVIGAKGLRATLGIMLGGVAQQIVEYACCPVLVVRAPYTGLRRILLATDGSEYSRTALDYLIHFPIQADIEVTAVHVVTPPPPTDFLTRAWPPGVESFPPMPVPEIDEAVQRQANLDIQQGQSLLNQTSTQLETAGIQADHQLLSGDAATVILDVVKTKSVDLIVLGSRGLSQVRGWLLGSVSRKLVHYAPCSVLIVKQAREWQERMGRFSHSEPIQTSNF